MSSRIPQTFIDDLLDRVDIVEVIDTRVKLKKSGKNYSACCPFHDEKTPSFTVSPDKQFYYCFGCGASGNAIGFVIDYERLSFPEAVDSLARLSGLEVPREAREVSPEDNDRKRIYQLLTKSDQYYRLQLRRHPQRAEPVDYLKGRGLSGEIARDFGIGYAPPGWDNLLRELGTGKEEKRLLTSAGMLIDREADRKCYDRFRHRIMFPIHDTRGRVIGFGGRVLGDDKPKYLNSPETPVFHKGLELYGLYQARQAYRELPRLLVVEGYMDVVALAQFGIRYAVATLGTACGAEHLRRAFKYTAEVVFCFDGDSAGRTAARRALESALPTMEDGRQVKFLFLPEGEDPDTLIRQVGAEKFARMIDNALPLEEFLFNAVAEGLDIQSMEGRARLSKLAAPLLGRIPKGVFRELMFDSLANRTGLSRDTLSELITASPESPPADLHQPEAAVPDPAPAAPANAPAAAQATAPPAATREPGPLKRQPRNRSGHQVRLPPQKMISVLLLQHPELARELEDTACYRDAEDDDLALFAELAGLLQKNPNYTIGGILGYWMAAHGAQATAALAELAGNHMPASARQLHHFDPQTEFRDSLAKIHALLDARQHRLLLEKVKSSAFNQLSEDDKQRTRELLAKYKK
ncbi:DNA primase [Exilibacterium tricleocarpae]|uniref:DNA primase n=1 Tax=Exilibacterium tricleocarpae TaxID=2591008 RepID=A0A545T3K4_9GAMM|nr:DNA primase [Exilibacterium tricleocarpae]TQV71803.1 DNA primase [Exilibacterium tricleocarpae]